MDPTPQSRNLLLAAVPPQEYEQLKPPLESYSLRMREPLKEAGELAEYVDFPTSGIISMFASCVHEWHLSAPNRSRWTVGTCRLCSVSRTFRAAQAMLGELANGGGSRSD